MTGAAALGALPREDGQNGGGSVPTERQVVPPGAVQGHQWRRKVCPKSTVPGQSLSPGRQGRSVTPCPLSVFIL